MSSVLPVGDTTPIRPACVLVDLQLGRRTAMQATMGARCATVGVATVDEALEFASAQGVVVVHDPPGTDAVRAAQLVRTTSPVPVIAICTPEVSCETKLAMFAAGVDDVVVSGVDPRELLARLAAVSRRAAPAAPAIGDASVPAPMTVGGVRLDLASRTVSVDGVQRPLTRKEFDVLRMLAGSPGRTVRRDDIARRVWRRDPSGLDHTIDSHIASLRTKLGLRSLIKTVRGVGYRLDGDRETP